MSLSIEGISDALAAWKPLELPIFGRREASVLIPLLQRDDGIYVLLTRRAPDLARHAGEISFPGGAAEPHDESSYDTAVREANEEIGLDPALCTHLGTLDDTVTLTGFRVRPHVALVENHGRFRVHEPEVDQVLCVPLERFAAAGNSYAVHVEGRSLRERFPLYVHQGNIIWGATARMVANLVAALSGPAPDGGGLFEEMLRRLVPLVADAKKIILSTHVNPDPDGLGAQMGLEEMFVALGKEVVIANNDPIPSRFDFLSFRSPVYTGEDVRPELAADADLLLVVDTAEDKRLGTAARLLEPMGAARTAVLDHHLSGNIDGAAVLVDKSYSSASEIIYQVLSTMGYPLSVRAAEALYAGILFDTHGFRYVQNRSRPFKIAGHLVDLGADALGIQEALFAAVSRAHVKVLRHALSTMHEEFGGRWLWSFITRDALDAAGGTAEDAGDIAPFFVSMEGTQVGTFFRELPDGRFKASFRSTRGYPIGDICAMLGGGGHANAAGAMVEGPVEDVIARIRPAMAKLFEDPPA